MEAVTSKALGLSSAISGSLLSGWPALRVAGGSTRSTPLHLWTQIVGKIKMAKAPAVNHWWHVTYTVSREV